MHVEELNVGDTFLFQPPVSPLESWMRCSEFDKYKVVSKGDKFICVSAHMSQTFYRWQFFRRNFVWRIRELFDKNWGGGFVLTVGQGHRVYKENENE